MTDEKYTVQQLVEKFNTIQLPFETMHSGFECFDTTTFGEFINHFNMNANLDEFDMNTVNEVLEICFDLVKDQFNNDKYNQIGKINCWFWFD